METCCEWGITDMPLETAQHPTGHLHCFSFLLSKEVEPYPLSCMPYQKAQLQGLDRDNCLSDSELRDEEPRAFPGSGIKTRSSLGTPQIQGLGIKWLISEYQVLDSTIIVVDHHCLGIPLYL